MHRTPEAFAASPTPRPLVCCQALFLVTLLLLGAGSREANAQLPPPPGDTLALQDAMADLMRIRDAGGWPTVPSGATLRLGDHDARVAILRNRLELSGDLRDSDPQPMGGSGPAEDPNLFDESLDQAVRRFQSRHTLDVDGAVGSATQAAMNVPVEARIPQIALNLERRREFRAAPASSPFRILVNIPAFEAIVLEEGREPRIHRVVVGRVDRPTPLFEAKIENVVLSPYWNVPPGILTLDKLPEIRRDPSYIMRSRMSVIERSTGAVVAPSTIDWGGISAADFNARYYLRQATGPANALGLVKFIFPNPYHVFLHDTPDRHLFERGRRAFSSGCMRIEGALDLAEQLLSQVPGWSETRIRYAAGAGTEVWVPLPEPVPIQTVYWTAWVGADGTLNFSDDLYGLDAGRQIALMSEEMSECAQV